MTSASSSTRSRPSDGVSGGLSQVAQAGYTPVFFAGLVLVAALAVWFFWPTTGIGYLLDDYLHVGYLDEALRGDPSELLKRLYGVWSYTTDSLSSYRPGVTLSFWLDYTLGHGQAFVMHLSNVVLTALACVAVALVAMELALALQLENATLTALGAGLLFAVYPLHPEATAWVVARADVIGALLYLLSMWSFLRLRRTGKQSMFILSLCFCFTAFTMKETTVTLPLAVTLAALFIYPGTPLRQVAGYWGVLGSFAVLRTMIIGQLVGGYGDVGIDLKQIWRNYTDNGTLLKLFYGATEELPAPSYLRICDYFALSLSGVLALSAAITNFRAARLFAFLILWSALSLAPAFQIWHIYPNLVGSRIFWIGSAPLCLLIAFAALAGAEKLPKNPLRMPVGIIAIALLTFCWHQILQINLIPWTVAGQNVAKLQAQVIQLASSVQPGKRVLLADIPQDYKGAPEVGRPEFLESICRSPFSQQDLSSRIVTAQRPIAGGHEFIYPRLLNKLRQTASSSLVWNDATGSYEPLVYEGSGQPISIAFNGQNAQRNTWDPNITIEADGNWTRLDDNVATLTDTGLSLHVGTRGLTCWLALEGAIDPSQLQYVELHTECKDSFQKTGGKVPAFIWRAESMPEQSCQPAMFKQGVFTYAPARQKTWALAKRVNSVGFQLPAGDYFITLVSARIEPASTVEPSTEIHLLPEFARDATRELWLTQTNETQSKLWFDASNIPDCAAVRIFVTRPWHALPDSASAQDPPSKTIEWSTDIQSTSGQIALPSAIFTKPGVRQVAVLPLALDGSPCGVSSEPRSIKIPLK